MLVTWPVGGPQLGGLLRLSAAKNLELPFEIADLGVQLVERIHPLAFQGRTRRIRRAATVWYRTNQGVNSRNRTSELRPDRMRQDRYSAV